MQAGLILSQQDIKKIIAEHFKVSEDKVIASKYSFIVDPCSCALPWC